MARNVWSVNLNVETESERRLYIKSGSINWNELELEEQDAAMIDIIILLIVTATPNRSILVDSPYRNVPKQKLRRSLMETLPGPAVENVDPLMEYVNFKYKQDMQIDGELNESLEIDLLRVNLEASTNMRADTVDLLVEKLKLVEITDDPSQASSIIKELSRKFAGNEKVFQNEYFVESASQKSSKSSNWRSRSRGSCAGRGRFHKKKLRLRSGLKTSSRRTSSWPSWR